MEEKRNLRKQDDKLKTAMGVSLVSIIINLLLCFGKAVAGVLGHSGAMLSDAAHSASDVFSTVIVIIGMKLSEQEADEQHPYGHERLECVAAIILSILLLVTGGVIGYQGLHTLFYEDPEAMWIPGRVALLAAILSIVVKEGLYRYTMAKARQICSAALKADAWHHRSDALSSVGAFFGIGAARLGYPRLEALASILICFLIFKATVEIFREAVEKMVDKACDKEIERKVCQLICTRKGVLGVSKLHTRMFGTRLYVDVEINADGKLSLAEAHAIAHDVHDTVEREILAVKHCMVHVNPVEATRRKEEKDEKL